MKSPFFIFALLCINCLLYAAPAIQCYFDSEVNVDTWPVIVGESYGVTVELWSISGPHENCMITFRKPDGEEFTIGPYDLNETPLDFKYHLSLPCAFALLGYAHADMMVDCDCDIAWHDEYWFFVRSPDLNCDGIVNATDLLVVIGAWGDCGGAMCLPDMNIDDQVNTADVMVLIEYWGPTK